MKDTYRKTRAELIAIGKELSLLNAKLTNPKCPMGISPRLHPWCDWTLQLNMHMMLFSEHDGRMLCEIHPLLLKQ